MLSSRYWSSFHTNECLFSAGLSYNESEIINAHEPKEQSDHNNT